MVGIYSGCLFYSGNGLRSTHRPLAKGEERPESGVQRGASLFGNRAVSRSKGLQVAGKGSRVHAMQKENTQAHHRDVR